MTPTRITPTISTARRQGELVPFSLPTRPVLAGGARGLELPRADRDSGPARLHLTHAPLPAPSREPGATRWSACDEAGCPAPPALGPLGLHRAHLRMRGRCASGPATRCGSRGSAAAGGPP